MTTVDRTIRTALRSNAIFSGAAGVIGTVAAGRLAAATDLPGAALRGVGPALVVYAVVLWTWASREPVRSGEAWLAVAGDVGWVVATVVLLIVSPATANVPGRALLAGVAVVVACFALAQIVGIRELQE